MSVVGRWADQVGWGEVECPMYSDRLEQADLNWELRRDFHPSQEFSGVSGWLNNRFWLANEVQGFFVLHSDWLLPIFWCWAKTKRVWQSITKKKRSSAMYKSGSRPNYLLRQWLISMPAIKFCACRYCCEFLLCKNIILRFLKKYRQFKNKQTHQKTEHLVPFTVREVDCVFCYSRKVFPDKSRRVML